MEDADAMRNAWLSTFVEMKYHRNPERAIDCASVGRQFRAAEDEEDEEEEVEEAAGDAYAYRCVLPCGQVRNHCSYNSA